MKVKSIILKPMYITLKHVIKKPITVQYPAERPVLPENYRGLHRYHPERCIKCEMCARVCPNKCIEIKTSRTADGKKKFDEYNIFIGRCMFCGLCVEACPAKPTAIEMTSEYELADFGRKAFLYDASRLAHKKEGER